MKQIVTIFCLLLAINQVFSGVGMLGYRWSDRDFPATTLQSTRATADNTTTNGTVCASDVACTNTRAAAGAANGNACKKDMAADKCNDATFQLAATDHADNGYSSRNRFAFLLSEDSDPTWAKSAHDEPGSHPLLATNGNAVHSVVQDLAAKTNVCMGVLDSGAYEGDAETTTAPMDSINLLQGSAQQLGLTGASDKQIGSTADALSYNGGAGKINAVKTTLTQLKKCATTAQSIGSMFICKFLVTAFSDTTGAVLATISKGAATIPAQNTDMEATIIKNMVTTPLPYFCGSFLAGIIAGNAGEEADAKAMDNMCNTIAGGLALKEAWSARPATLGAMTALMLQTWLKESILLRAGFSAGAQTYMTSPTLDRLGNSAYCKAFSSATAANNVWDYPSNINTWYTNSKVDGTKVADGTRTKATAACHSIDSYKGMPAAFLDPNTVTGLTTTITHASWTVAATGICGTTKHAIAANEKQVENCCMNSVTVQDFVHCMNFLSAVDVNKTGTNSGTYINLLHTIGFPATPTSATCISMLKYGLNWLTAGEIYQFKQTCYDTTSSTALGAALKALATGTIVMTQGGFDTAYKKYWNTWNLSNTWTSIRASQLGSTAACAAAFGKSTDCASAPAAPNNLTASANMTVQNATTSAFITGSATAGCSHATADTAKDNALWANNCCLNAQTVTGFGDCIRSALGTDTKGTGAKITVSASDTSLQNVVGSFHQATGSWTTWDLLKAKHDNLARVWGWVSPSRYWELYNLFGIGTWWTKENASLWDNTKDRTFIQYKTALNSNPSGFGQVGWLGSANCVAKVTGKKCAEFNQFNSLFSNDLWRSTTLCPAATADKLHADFLKECCDRSNEVSAKACATWAPKTKLAAQKVAFATAFSTAAGTSWNTALTGSLKLLTGDAKVFYNCANKLMELPLTGFNITAFSMKYCKNKKLWDLATKTDGANSCNKMTNITDFQKWAACMLSFSDSTSGGTATTGPGTGTTATGGTATTGTTTSTNCTCASNVLRTMGFGLIMAMLLNMMN